MSKSLPFLLLVVASVACGNPPQGFTTPDANNSTLSEGGTTNDASSVADTNTSQPDAIPVMPQDPNAGCSDASRLVYLLSDRNELYSFRPNLRQLTRIGVLNCPTTFSPNSMSIDRNAVAWVNYVDNDGFSDSAGRIYRVSTETARCTSDTPLSLPDGWYRLGMGFSTEGRGSTREQLFITGTGDALFGDPSPGLGSIDPTAPRLRMVGQFTRGLAGENAELTGTGDGRLFGFFTTTPVQVAEIDKSSGSVVSTRSLPQVETPAAWAFAFWGGDFYLFTAPSPLSNPGRTTNVTRYRPSDQSVDASFMTNIGFRVVGAGVSTCAPIEPPG